MLAVKAYDKQQLIGYVSALEGEDVRALIIARKERNLRTRCIGCNSKNEGDKAGLQLMVRALSDKKKVCHGLMTHLFIFYLSFLNILSTTIAMAPSPVTLQAVPKLSIAI